MVHEFHLTITVLQYSFPSLKPIACTPPSPPKPHFW
uniref:Uncharacterized protein n=1 Tax=Anguilla anguilla TaxID=7936 RepID=A0A0E9V4J4_ANGAN